MAAAYFKAAIPEPFRILGLKLKPFSLGHYFWMQRCNCSFVADGDAVATISDLVIGILICSMTHDEFTEFLDQADCLEQVEKWGDQIGDADLNEKAAMFASYIDQGTQQPKFWIEEDGKPSGAHWSQSLWTTLRGPLNYSRSEALNAPLTQALADFYKHGESIGVLRFMTDYEIEAAHGTKT